ncbi:MAG: serine hydroxymethyltransferase, partial [Chloroflexota bacterium]|nr:serine hydroxymethyltransferase [Chloroflexota bacterium]
MSSALQGSLANVDPEIAELVAAELKRQSETICLIPSENHVSAAVMAATGSV